MYVETIKNWTRFGRCNSVQRHQESIVVLINTYCYFTHTHYCEDLDPSLGLTIPGKKKQVWLVERNSSCIEHTSQSNYNKVSLIRNE